MDNLKQQVIDAGRELFDSGLIAGTWGNVSIRTDSSHFAITASGREYDGLTEDEIISLKLSDLSYSGDIAPSGEKKVHQKIYMMRDDARFIIHTHQTNASAVAAMGLSEIRFTKRYPGMGYTVPCAAYGLPGSRRVASAVAKALRSYDTRAVLMSNHGAVCFGRDKDEAFETVYALEEACGHFLRNIDVEPWEYSGEEYGNAVKYWHFDSIGAYLDDFAQMFGTHLNLRNYNPQKLASKYGEDVDAVRMVVDKNCRAGLAAVKTGCRPLKTGECLRMRRNYKKKYSKLRTVDR